jgi:UDP-N-acetylmuramate--alanine ligase
MFSEARLVVAFQPHLYSRTQDFADAFGVALASADLAFVTDVFPAREAPIPGISGEIVVSALRKAGHSGVRYVPEIGDLSEALLDELKAGDVLVTLGAGSIEDVAPLVFDGLEAGVHA